MRPLELALLLSAPLPTNLPLAPDPSLGGGFAGGGQSLWLTIFFILVVLVAAYYATRWYSRRSMRMTGSSAVMKVVDRVALDKGSGIVLLRVADQLYLVAVTQAGAILLDKLDPGIVDDAALLPQGETLSFQSVIAQQLKRMGVAPRPRPASDEDASAEQLGELERLVSQRKNRLSERRDQERP